MFKDELCRKGYAVLPEKFFVSDSHISGVQASTFHDIFNQVDRDGNVIYSNKRQQSVCKEKWVRPVTVQFRQYLQRHELLHEDNKTSMMLALRSLPGCEKQVEHCDSGPQNSFSHLPLRYIPLACLITIQENTHIYVKSLETNIETKVHLHVGDVFVFRGDVLHSGAEYNTQNIRLHMYIDSCLCQRPKNTTFLN